MSFRPAWPRFGKDHPVTTLERHQRLSPQDRDRLGKAMAKEYGGKARPSLATLAEQFGTSPGRCRLLLLEQGVQLRSRGGDTRSPAARAARGK